LTEQVMDEIDLVSDETVTAAVYLHNTAARTTDCRATKQ